MSIIASIVISLVIAAVSIVLSELLRPKPDLEDAKPAGLGDFNFPTAIEGRAIPVVFGTVQIAGPNVIWWGDLRAESIRETIKTGLWSKKRLTVGYRYYVGIQLALCLGQVDEVSEIWVGDTSVGSGSVQDGSYAVDLPKLYGGDKIGNGGMIGTFRVRSGDAAQGDNSYLSALQSPYVPNRGVCEVVWEGGYIGNGTNLKPWKFEVKRFPNTLGLTSNRHIVNSNDANPAAMIYETLTNDDWGFGLPIADVDAANFRTVGNTLYDEGNGFSMTLDRTMEAVEFLQLIQEQIDGIVYLDQEDGLFKISLARDDYDIDLVPQLSEDTGVIEVKEFTRATWEETSNQVRIEYLDRARGYFGTFAQAHDLGNQRIQGGEIVSSTQKYPGVKDKTLATSIADRELRQLAVPLAKGTIVVDRTYWNVKPNDVLAWTDDNLGFTKLPVRVTRIDYGNLAKGEITLSVVQDVFKLTTPFFGEPDSTLWSAPTQDVAELDESLVMEAPKAISKRDPDGDPALEDRVWAGARRNTGGEVLFQIYQRNASGTPSGSYTEDSGDIVDFLYVGEIHEAVAPGAQEGSATIKLKAASGGDSIEDMAAQFTTSPAAADIGANLVNLCYIDTANGGEFFAPTSVVNQTTHLDLTGCWRGLLDTLPGSHVVGAKVYLMFMGGNLNLAAIEQGYNVDVQLRAESRTDVTTEGEATLEQLTMSNRAQKPYPPASPEFNGTVYGASVQLDDTKSGGSGLDDKGLDLSWIRRDFETYSETQGITTDGASIDTDFPTKHSTQYDVDVVQDITSLNTDLEAFWKLEESSGATRLDETANNHDLSDTGTVPQVAAQIGNGVSFDTGTRYLQVAGTGEFNFGANADFMICGWVYLTDKSSSYTFWSKDESTSDRGWHVRYSSGPDRFTFAYSDDGSALNTEHADNFGSPTAGTWYFIVAYHDGANDEVGISVNGGAFDTAAHSLGINQSLQEFTMGGHWSSTTLVNKPNGRTDAVGIWDRILTDAEIAVLYNGGAGREGLFSSSALHDPGWNSGEGSDFLSRTSIVKQLGGSLPSSLDITIATRHTLNGVVRTADQQIEHSVTVDASALANDTWLGELAQNVTSGVYTAPDTGTYNFEIGTALPTGAVEARINGGSWTSVISATNTTGTLAGVVSSDTIEVRHTDASPTNDTFLQIDAPTSTAGAFAVLT